MCTDYEGVFIWVLPESGFPCILDFRVNALKDFYSIDFRRNLVGIIQILGAVLQDPGEFNKIEHPVLDGSLLVHVVDLLVGEAVAHRGQQFTQIVFVKSANIRFVEASEGVSYDVFWIRTLESFTEESEKHGEVDGTRCLVHHLVQVLVTHLLSQGSQHILEIIVIDEPVPVLVNHVEGFLELLDLILVEHGEDVGGGALGTLLRARTSGRFSARHLGGPSAIPVISGAKEIYGLT